MVKIFRFDDICINTDMTSAIAMAEHLRSLFPTCNVMFCVSPLVNDMSESESSDKQRIFPRIYTAHSDHREFYKVDKCGVPDFPLWIKRAGHGLVHVDHRLMNKEAQELSILTSCELVSGYYFVPPFNKWNKLTEEICNEHHIELIKFEDGWLSMEHNKYDANHMKYYLHNRAFTVDQFKGWFK